MKRLVKLVAFLFALALIGCAPALAVSVDDILDAWSEKGTGGIIAIVEDPEDAEREAYRVRLLTSMSGPVFRSEINSLLEDDVPASYFVHFRIRIDSHDSTTQGILLTQLTPACWVHVRLKEKAGDFMISVADIDEGAEASCDPPNRLPSEEIIDEENLGAIDYDEWIELKLSGLADGANSRVRLKRLVLGEWEVIYAWSGTLNRETPAEWHFGAYTGTSTPEENYQIYFQVLGYNNMASTGS